MGTIHTEGWEGHHPINVWSSGVELISPVRVLHVSLERIRPELPLISAFLLFRFENSCRHVLVQKLKRTIVPLGLYFDVPCYCLVNLVNL